MNQNSIFLQTYLWEYEKGVTNNKADKGGLTNDGITMSHYLAYCKEVLGRTPTLEHFTNMSQADIFKFYARVWKRMSCDKIDNMLLAGICFDFGFNSEFAKREIQEVLQKLGFNIQADNVFGPQTINTLNQAYKKHGLKLLYLIMSARMTYVTSLVYREESQLTFIVGWVNRITDWIIFIQKNG